VTAERFAASGTQSAEAVPTRDRLRAITRSELAPTETPRPPRRTQATERREQPDRPQPSAAPGNAERTARAGTADGTPEREVRSAGPRDSEGASQAGNAAASNYPGDVLRRVSRVRRPDVSGSGAARVTFSIAGTGALAGARVSRSSGSGALDRAALTVIRRAAPFPAPPAGATRTFTVEIRGR
jgi:protein TonB